MYSSCFFIAAVIAGSYAIVLPPTTCNATTEHKNYCGTVCERTCSNVLQHSVPCPMICGPPGCECNQGLARYNGQCVTKRECPADSFVCPANEHVDGCGNMCELTCARVRNNQLNVACPMICMQPECVCDQGYARHGGVCVKIEAC